MSRLTHAVLFDRDRLDVALAANDAPLEAFQAALGHGRDLLAEHHLEGGSAATLVKYHSWLVDQLLTVSWQQFVPAGGRPMALVAAGGYGRCELNLGSDIDLLILVSGKVSPDTVEALEAFIRFCWDIGLKVGHSTRSVADCVTQAKQDLTVITNLMETRLLVGDRDLYGELQKKVRSRRIWPSEKYFVAKLKEQQERHLRYGDTAYNLEPNIKESPGGLRDLHMISWVANRYFGTSDLHELVQHEFLTDTEYRALIKGRDFLWRLRNGLHLLSGRCEDRLLFDYQRELAAQLGYQQGENHLAVEHMMKRYYRTVQELQLLNELLLQHFQEAILVRRKPRTRKINRRFQVVGDYLEVTSNRIFEHYPIAILELFYLLQQKPELKGVRAATIRQLRANLHRIDDDFRDHIGHRTLFLEIFRHQEGLTHALRRMNAYGVLGAFFPEFGRVVGLMQHDLFHVYTVDAHSLFVVRNLRRLMIAQHYHEFPLLSDLINKLNKRERLFLAALCHDVGKGSGRDHSVVGAEIATDLCRRLDLSDYDTAFVTWLVRHHLTMSWTAQREDTTDPRVIDRFAAVVGDQEHLDNLYLLTVADVRGTSPKVWNEWKGQLLSNLYTATSRRLRTGLGGAEAITERIEARKEAIRNLVAGKVPETSLEKLWGQLGEEYFLRNGPETSAWHAEQIHRTGLLDLPLVTARYRDEIKARQILVVAPESESLLLRITAGLDKLNLSIFDARIHQTLSGLALCVFIVSSQDDQPATDEDIQTTTRQLKTFLLHPPASYQPVSRVLSRALRQFRVPTTVTFGKSDDEHYTTMEVIAQDRPGLLFHVSRALLECKVKLVSAKVSTVGEKAEDTFFITDRDGRPVDAPDIRHCLEERLQQYLSPLGEE